jgi:S1-C subfamily serine protease
VISCVGSGTLVSEDGPILTNAHVALAGPNCRSERIVIALTLRIGEAPVARYYAEVVGTNVGWDLAVLQINSELDGRPINPANLSLPFVEVGDSETVRLDDTIEVVGYTTPEKDNQSGGIAKSVRGTVSGFTAEARVGDRAWIKTRAPIPGDATGGGAYSVDGKLIGIPTIEPARSEGAIQNCRRIQDSTGDGRIDDQDVCIPVSGLINALRPTRLARGLILAAKLGISAQSMSAAPASSAAPAGQPTFSRLLFAPGVDSAGMPTSLVGGMPAGTTRLYLFFDYDNLVDGMIYELRVTRDGVPDPVFSLAPATWSGGRRGLWYVGSTAQVWPNGVYDFTLFIEGTRAASRKLTTAARPAPIRPSRTSCSACPISTTNSSAPATCCPSAIPSTPSLSTTT